MPVRKTTPDGIPSSHVAYGQVSAPLNFDRDDFTELFAYWSAKRIGGALPLSTDMDLLDLAHLLPQMTLIDFLDSGTLIARFLGPSIVGRLGHDMTGQNLLAFHAEPTRPVAAEGYQRIAEQPCGAMARYVNLYNSGREARSQVLYLPVQTPSDGIRRIVGAHATDEVRGFHQPSETATLGTEILCIDWIDIGFGVPDDQERP